MACRWLQYSNGEPSGRQMDAYLRADCAGRVRRITPCSTGHHSHRGSSTTLRSDRNWARYLRSAAGVGASGVPRFMRTTAVVAAVAAPAAGVVIRDFP